MPLIIGSNEPALAAATGLLDHGFLVPAIRYPTVPRDTARLRITFSADHQSSDIDTLAAHINTLQRTTPTSS